jgi:hypothetical protein
MSAPPTLNAQPLPIEAPLPLVRWHFSFRLPLVRRLVVASTSASALRHLLSCSRRTHLSSTPPLCSRQLVVVSHLFAPPPPLDAPPPHNWLCHRRRRCAGVVCDDSANLTVRQEGSPKSALPELDFFSIKFPNASTDSECFLAFKCEKSPSHADGQTTPNASPTCFIGGTSIVLVD